MGDRAIPFGMLFLERKVNGGEVPVPEYDEERDVSVVEANGHMVPLVTASSVFSGTETITEVAGEETDHHSHGVQSVCRLGTDTETKAEVDYTQIGLEPSLVMAMATETTTRVAGEDTD